MPLSYLLSCYEERAHLQLILHLTQYVVCKGPADSGSVCIMGSLTTEADISHSCVSFPKAVREMQSLVSPMGAL